jgi:hypothetical protein
MPVRVVSKRAGGTKPVAGEVVINIARPSILGNPFHMAHESQRDTVIQQYHNWLGSHYHADDAVWAEVKQLAARVKAGESLALQCWCAPCACHGDVLVKAINWINEQ